VADAQDAVHEDSVLMQSVGASGCGPCPCRDWPCGDVIRDGNARQGAQWFRRGSHVVVQDLLCYQQTAPRSPAERANLSMSDQSS
jgi:hypothetical protein